MCTCITYENGDFYFGRNMDLEYRFGEKVVITPRNYVLPLKVHPAQKLSYAMIGMAAVREEYPLYAEAVNENGLGMAGLNFPGNAAYREARKGSQNITPYELIPWVLGQCACRKEAVALLQELNLLNVPFAEGLPLTPLHWMIADRSGCSVLESTEEGVRIYENPYGVLTNNPPFPYYQHHMGNYRNLTAKTPDDNFAGALKLPLLGQGQGAAGLPGDFSPVSRFVRAVFLKWNSRSERDRDVKYLSILSCIGRGGHGPGICDYGERGAGYDDVFLLRQRGQGRLLLQDLRKPSDTGGGHEQ